MFDYLFNLLVAGSSPVKLRFTSFGLKVFGYHL